jgi:hypothetical protein
MVLFFFITWEVADSGVGMQPFPKSADLFAAALHNVQPGKVYVLPVVIDLS